jgi:hypothetical protein
MISDNYRGVEKKTASENKSCSVPEKRRTAIKAVKMIANY